MLAHLLLTFQHRAGVSPYTSSYDFAEACVFDKQSLPPGPCHLSLVAQRKASLLPKLRDQFAEFLQHHLLIHLRMLYVSTSVGLEYGHYCHSYFLEVLQCPVESNYPRHFTTFVTIDWSRNINLVPIDYGFRPRLRGRLTLRGLSLRRKPWTFGGPGSHRPLVLLMSAFSLLIPPAFLTEHLRRPTERFATTHIIDMHPHLRCIVLAPLHFRRRTTFLDQ